MKEQFVYDPLISKRQQYLLATQLVRAVLKIGKVFSRDPTYSLIRLVIRLIILVSRLTFLTDDVITSGAAEE
jgi:hypothetical protein